MCTRAGIWNVAHGAPPTSQEPTDKHSQKSRLEAAWGGQEEETPTHPIQFRGISFMYFGVHSSAQLQHKMFYLSSFCQTLGHGGLLWGLTSNPSDPCTSLPGNALLSRQAVPRGHSPGGWGSVWHTAGAEGGHNWMGKSALSACRSWLTSHW